MSVGVVVPWRGGCSHRERAWQWARARHRLPVELAAGGDPWVKALAVMPAIERSAAEVLVVADADVWCEGIAAAVEAVECGAAWAIPHRGVFRLDERSTLRLLAGEPFEELDCEQRPYLGLEGGGIVVARRETLLEVPLDPRFVGWGQEDEAWGFALGALLGRPWRSKQPLFHLWHPPQPRHSRERGSIEGWELRRRYATAIADPALMQALIEEAKHALAAHQHPVRDHAPASV